jgi:hypothetical protein
MKVAGRGRIKKEIIDAYDEAHKWRTAARFLTGGESWRRHPR